MRRIAVLVMAAVTLLLGEGSAYAREGQTLIYLGGPIVTMAGDEPETVEAVAVRGGTIVAIGSRAEVERKAGRRPQRIDLKGCTLLPGFIDAHGHVSMVGRYAMMADLSGPPVGKVTTIAALQDALRAHQLAHPEGVISGRGYDDAVLKGGRHPTRLDLDAVSAERPIAIIACQRAPDFSQQRDAPTGRDRAGYTRSGRRKNPARGRWSHPRWRA